MRWRPRFSLRTLVVFLLLVTSGCGLWWHWEPWVYHAGGSAPRASQASRVKRGPLMGARVRRREVRTEAPTTAGNEGMR